VPSSETSTSSGWVLPAAMDLRQRRNTTGRLNVQIRIASVGASREFGGSLCGMHLLLGVPPSL
jgi:hypothetical protein